MLKYLTFSRGQNLFYNPQEFQVISFRLFTLEGVAVLMEGSREAVLGWELSPGPWGMHKGKVRPCAPHLCAMLVRCLCLAKSSASMQMCS